MADERFMLGRMAAEQLRRYIREHVAQYTNARGHRARWHGQPTIGLRFMDFTTTAEVDDTTYGGDLWATRVLIATTRGGSQSCKNFPGAIETGDLGSPTHDGKFAIYDTAMCVLAHSQDQIEAGVNGVACYPWYMEDSYGDCVGPRWKLISLCPAGECPT